LERLESQIEEQHHENLLAVRVGLRDLPQPVPAELDEFLVLKALRERAAGAQTKEEKARIVDILATWPTIQAASALREIAEEPWARERAALILTYRFGEPAATAGWNWDGWHHWLLRCEREVQRERRELDQLAGQRPGELLLIWHSRQEGGDPQLRTLLADWCRRHTRPMDPEGFTVRWSDQIPARELNALLGRDRRIRERAEPVPIAEPIAEPVAAAEPPPAPPEAPPLRRPIPRPPPVPRRDPEPAVPSMWKDHIQPFLVEHWFMVAGILMVIAGSSVTAYYTWDKHWLLRYTLMPAMLAGFTVALATVGTWIEKKGTRFRDTAAMLRGAAIGLLPVNFMAVALLASDEQVAYKVLTVPLLGAVFLVLFGWGLRRWCAAVHAPLGTLLGGTLLVINSLVVLAPVVRSLGLVGDRELLFLLGAGFHLGFLILAVAVVRFTGRVLTRELAEEKRVPWFFGATAAVTFLQVFAWVHGSIGHLPEVTTYAPMIILTGWLVLLVERRTLELKEETGHHDAESFLGFALILLGLLMGIAHPHVRILSFLLAGAAWLAQALSRRHPLHDWISLTLLALAGASVGSLEIFPGSWLPALGIALSLAMGGLGYLSRRREQPELARASTGMRMAVLVVTTVVATLAQWHYDSPPLVTAAYLLVIAGLCGWQARRDQELRWVHTAMVILALALPYLGFVDMTGRTLRGNTMVFGLAALSLLWLAVNWSTRSPLVRNARSTVLWIYGSLAVAAMGLRVIIERDLPGDVLWYRDFMDYTGPLLMAVVLIFTTYYSRSLIPAGMAAVIVIILFPELRANLRVTFEDLGWGSGLASAASALGLTLLCFLLRRAAFLKDLGEGDLYMGRDPFPLRRYDHRLFVWPLLASIVFLLIKVDTWNLLRNLFGDGVRVRTVVALGLTGVTWTLLAVFQRRHRLAVGGTHLGWIWLSVSIAFGYVVLVDVPRWPHPMLATGVVLQGLYFLYRFGLAPRHAWVDALLSGPTRQVLRSGSQIVSVICLIALLVGRDPAALWPLMIFLAAQMIWHGLASRSFACGSLLFLLVWVGLVARTAGVGGELLGRLSIDQSLSPTLQLLLGIQILHLLLERKPDHHQALAPLVRPFMFAGSLLAVVLAVGGCLDYFSGPEISFSQQVLLLAVVLLTARAHGSGPLWLSGVFLGYLLVHFDALREVVGPGARFGLLLSPWRWGLLALAMAILGHAGSVLSRRRPALLEGAFSFAFLRSPSVAWLFVPAVGFSCLAAVIQPALRDSAVQLWAPYLGAATLGLVAWSRRRIALWTVAVILVTLGNIHAVRIFWGDFLLEQGLSAIHLLCLGLAAGLVQAFLLRLLPGRSAVAVTLNRASLVLAAGVLALLSINYFAHPNLEAISALRFLISGGMALLAGWYFRRAARDPGPGQESYVEVCEGLYHFGVTMAIWCAALLVPVLRHPTTALWALGLPVLYFYARAELDLRAGLETGRRYRNSATILGFVILGLYVFSGIFHLILFPDAPIPMAHYHVNSPFVMLLALLLLRLHGLGGSSWLAFYGGLALIAGSFFGLTALPALSPFRHPIAAAWCAVGLSHFWTLVSSRRSPVRTAIQDLAAIDGKGWLTLRRSWGIWLLLATQGAVLWGLMNASSSTYMVAPLLVGAASILIHQGLLRSSLLYYLVAVAEVGLALHADFFTPSYLPRGAVIWALLAIWAAVIVIARIASHRMRFERIGTLCGIMALAAFAHVIYHHPGSATGLWAVGLGALLAASTPRSTRGAQTAEERFFPALILGVPAWLVYFSQAPLRGAGPGGAFAVWPLLATVAAVFLTGSFS
ncbi:MAG: hypothetical protein GY856_17395, partial [bacterium]|nr:hypothetical protein [bacterium]